MHYYYDILTNFDETLWEFYEWEASDNLTPIKKIPFVRISSKELNDFFKYQIKVNPSWLLNYQNKTILKNSKEHPILLLLSSTKNSMVIELNEEGVVLFRSKLLIEDEINCNELAFSIKETSIPYEKGEKLLVRTEFRKAIEEKRFLATELKTLKESENKEKCSYLYYECFGKIENNFTKMIKGLENELQKPYSLKIHELVNLIKLSYKEQL